MKTLQELEAIRNKTLDKVIMRKEQGAIRVVVGMATCGIAAGARAVMTAFLEEVAARNLSHVTIAQTGCIGVCRLEPMVEVYLPGEEKVTYVKVDAEMVKRIVAEHLVNGHAVNEFTIGYYESHNGGQ